MIVVDRCPMCNFRRGRPQGTSEGLCTSCLRVQLLAVTRERDDLKKQPPDVFFWVKIDQSEMFARPPGAKICIHSLDDGTSSVRIYSGEWRRLAYVRVAEVWSEEDRTNEAMMIACALYWSHWRHLVQSGERPAEELDQRQNPCADTYHPAPFWKTSRMPEEATEDDIAKHLLYDPRMAAAINDMIESGTGEVVMLDDFEENEAT